MGPQATLCFRLLGWKNAHEQLTGGHFIISLGLCSCSSSQKGAVSIPTAELMLLCSAARLSWCNGPSPPRSWLCRETQQTFLWWHIWMRLPVGAGLSVQYEWAAGPISHQWDKHTSKKQKIEKKIIQKIIVCLFGGCLMVEFSTLACWYLLINTKS